MFYPLIEEKNLTEGLLEPKEIEGNKLLVVRHLSKTYIIENKCGHFGMPLQTGDLADGTITCKHHRISFDLDSGEVHNRPYENAEAIKTFEVVVKDGFVGVEL